MLDLQRHGVEVEVPVAQREQLALTQPCERRDQDEVAVGSDGVGGQLLDLVPVEEAHFRLLAPRRLHAEDALVDDVATELKELAKRFRDPDDPLRVVVVKDMWLIA